MAYDDKSGIVEKLYSRSITYQNFSLLAALVLEIIQLKDLFITNSILLIHQVIYILYIYSIE